MPTVDEINDAIVAIKEMKQTAYWYRGDHRMAKAIDIIETVANEYINLSTLQKSNNYEGD